jgi:hypothetical protein
MAFRMTGRLAVLTVLAVFAAWSARAAKEQPAEGNVQAGRAFALLACTGCHVVAPDQPFKPVYQGPPNPPDFKDIANQPGTTADSLRHYLERPAEGAYAKFGAVGRRTPGRRRFHPQSSVNHARRRARCFSRGHHEKSPGQDCARAKEGG